MLKEKLRLQVLNGALQDYKTYMQGTFRGFHVLVSFQNPSYIVKINAVSENPEHLPMLQAFLQEHQKATKLLNNINATAQCVTLTIGAPSLAKKLPEVLNLSIIPVVNWLVENGYSSGCAICGDTMVQSSCYSVNGTYHYICDTCAQQVSNSLQEKQQSICSQKSQLLPGIIGAFLGSLIGVIVWVLIYKLGYIASLAGFISAICAFKGYELLGKCLDKRGVIISVIMAFVMIFFANQIAWAWELYDVFTEYGYGYSFFDCYKILMPFISENGLTGDFITELIIGYGLTVLGCFKTVISTFKNSTGSYSVKKM